MRDLIELTELARMRAERFALTWNADADEDEAHITPEQFVSIATLFLDFMFHEKIIFALPHVTAQLAVCMQLVCKDDEGTQFMRQTLMQAMAEDDAANPFSLPRDEDAGV